MLRGARPFPPFSRLSLIPLLLTACGGSAGKGIEGPTPGQLRPIPAAVRAHLDQDAAPARWQDLDPAHPGARLRDPRTGIVFRRVPKGTFTMGSTTSLLEAPPHEVELTRDYLLAETEVTAAQWQRFVDEHGGPQLQLPPRAPDEPRTHLLHAEAELFCSTYGYRLPTEAEWERAARGAWQDADAPWRTQKQLEEFAWFHTNSKGTVHPVATRKPNAFGLHDMLGNVSEYCSDWFAPGYGDAARKVDPSGPPTGQGRSIRGGSWVTIPGPPPSFRSCEEPDAAQRRGSFYGFRPARSLD